MKEREKVICPICHSEDTYVSKNKIRICNDCDLKKYKENNNEPML